MPCSSQSSDLPLEQGCSSISNQQEATCGKSKCEYLMLPSSFCKGEKDMEDCRAEESHLVSTHDSSEDVPLLLQSSAAAASLVGEPQMTLFTTVPVLSCSSHIFNSNGMRAVGFDFNLPDWRGPFVGLDEDRAIPEEVEEAVTRAGAVLWYASLPESRGSNAQSDPPYSWPMTALWTRLPDRDLGRSSRVRCVWHSKISENKEQIKKTEHHPPYLYHRHPIRRSVCAKPGKAGVATCPGHCQAVWGGFQLNHWGDLFPESMSSSDLPSHRIHLKQVVVVPLGDLGSVGEQRVKVVIVLLQSEGHISQHPALKLTISARVFIRHSHQRYDRFCGRGLADGSLPDGDKTYYWRVVIFVQHFDSYFTVAWDWVGSEIFSLNIKLDDWIHLIVNFSLDLDDASIGVNGE
ncbi:hypothetical protein EYF80_022707 [Liparis tanakae]|uniref:Uncharacterized protein n=1 Tax=Liparis tanakae TaxID=230148 RepID=A0A4Z2HNE2_9TELE|nr:hypothetical protein EYF80_022707 [Liparis tanakae]